VAPFEVIPAVDVAAGRLVRLTAGEPRPSGSFGGDPVAAARAFAAAGARWVHVVDLDLSLGEGAPDRDLVRSVADVGVWVQASGGIATHEAVRAAFDRGAARVVLGSAALEDPVAVEDLALRYGDRLAVGLEVDAGRIAPRGAGGEWPTLTGALEWLAEGAAARFVVTAVPRVGGLGGPDLEAVSAVVALGRPVVAAGGVSSIDDLRALRALGAEGAIVGTAAVEGRLDIAGAIAELREGHG
jgi:phosphoribosylformimino-5-aminoimidazole carboxamide ribonucleotide (ProFAR) isomerase